MDLAVSLRMAMKNITIGEQLSAATRRSFGGFSFRLRRAQVFGAEKLVRKDGLVFRIII